MARRIGSLLVAAIACISWMASGASQAADKKPNKRFPGGASNDLMPNLQNPENPVPALDVNNPPQIKGGGG